MNGTRDSSRLGYAGDSKCHAVYMVEKAAEVLQVDLVNMKKNQKRRTKAETHSLLKDFAFCQLSPKLSYLFIPELRAMEEAVPPLMSACAEATPNDLCEKSLNDLRKLAFQRGILDAKRSFTRAELVSKLEFDC